MCGLDPQRREHLRKALTSNLVVKLATTLGLLALSVVAVVATAAAEDGRGEELFALCQQCHAASAALDQPGRRQL